MKSFLAAWLVEAPKIFAIELKGADLRPSTCLPQPESTVALAIVSNDGLNGRFTIAADKNSLQALLAEANITDGTLNAGRDRDLWCSILERIGKATIRAVGLSQTSTLIEEGVWRPGTPSAAYELCLGNTILPLAFIDEVQMVEKAVQDFVATPETKITSGGIDRLLDIELEASLRFGSREMQLSEVLDLGAGDVVELDRHVSDPVDLLVGDKIVARGEVVLVNGSFGLRVLEVAEPKKCLESIRCLF